MADYSSYVTSGLSGAKNAINNNSYQAYPDYTGGNKSNPYATQQNATGMAASGYNPTQGVVAGTGRDASQMYGDYQNTVDQSWNKAQGQIKNAYGANGLYGSMGGGLMSGVMQDGAGQYASASAQGRLAADQGVLADQIARANSYRDSYELAGNQNLDQWKAGMQTTDYNNQLLGNNVNFGNSQIDAAYQDQLARRNDQQAYNQLQIENYLGLAGGGSPMAGSQMSANAQQNAANQASDAANTGAWIGAGGSILGGLMGGIGQAGGWDNFWG
ncbi:MAG: hypothetical protein RBR38_10320 [Desulfomicrobium apsheronum]|nr:hypothetical protein [Desulfomicrobium apsheronum]